jgi:hypothetical protein
MKTTKLIVSIFTAVLMMVAAVDASAQVATNRQRRQIQKHEQVLKKSMKKKAIKAARKEAKQLKKAGYMTFIGQLPLDKQLENSWQAAYEIDPQGNPYYIMSTQKAVASNFTAAQMQAMNAAKTDIAGQLETRINQVIETKVSSNELGRNEANSLSTFVSTSKNIVSNTLGRVIKLVEIYREPKRTKNVEVQITLAYNAEIATKEALKAMKQSLTAEDVELMEQIDKLVTE